MADLDILKDIPGYKAILKSVIKTQIQLLVEQLSDHTGEESIILTASVNDGSLSHLGSCTGKGFLEGRDEIKSQFLGYCLKSHHRKKTQETTKSPHDHSSGPPPHSNQAKSPYDHSSGPPPHSNQTLPGPRTPVQHSAPKRPRIHPVSMSRVSAPGSRGSPVSGSGSVSDQTFSANRNFASSGHIPDRRTSIDPGGDRNIKIETSGDSQGVDSSFSDNVTSTPTSFPSTLQLSHTQTLAVVAADSDQSVAQTDDNKEASGDAESGKGSATNIKIEPITEGEMELEITGVELGDSSQDTWGQDLPPGIQMYGTSGAEGGDDLDTSNDQSGYNGSADCDSKDPPVKRRRTEIEDQTVATMMEAASNAVHQHMSKCGRRKRGEYERFTPEQRILMAKYCMQHGTTRAAKHFTIKFGKKVCESTLRGIRTKYLATPNRESLTGLTRDGGRPLKIGRYDTMVKNYIEGRWLSGELVNSQIVLAAAKGIVKHHDESLLVENGGLLDLNKTWATSLLRRMGLVKHGTKKLIEMLPTNFLEIKGKFTRNVEKLVVDDGIPAELVINWGQISINFVPAGHWTKQDAVASDVTDVVQKDHKEDRQMTLVVGITKSGHVLSPQLIYRGKTDICHPKYKFPNDYNIVHNEQTGISSETTEKYIKHIVLPYIESVRSSIGKSDQKAVAIIEKYNSHCTEDVVGLLSNKGVHVVFIPNVGKERLQPLYHKPKETLLGHMKAEFESFYSAALQQQLNSGADIHAIEIDLQLASLKPRHAEWLVNGMSSLATQTDLITQAFTDLAI